jgi:MFS family permease
LEDFGWRIAFLIGTLIIPFGLVVRRSLPETFHAMAKSQSDRISIRPYLPVAVIGLMMLGSGTIGTYISNYMTTYAIATLHMPAKVAFAATIVVGLSGVAVDLLSGALSDRLGRKLVMLIPGIVLLALIFPAFVLISRYRTTAILLGASAILACLLDFSVTPMIIWLTESLPAGIRSGGVAVVYAFAIATFGGSTQYVVAWLIQVTGNPLAPAWYWLGAAIIGLVAIVASHESAPNKILRLDSTPAERHDLSG